MTIGTLEAETEPATVPLSLFLPRPWRAEPERRAEESDRSLSAEVRQAIRAHLAGDLPLERPAAAREVGTGVLREGRGT